MPRLPHLSLLGIALVGCTSEPVALPTGPTVALVDSVVVADADTFPRREGARTLAMSPRGDLFAEIIDGVVQFAPDGEFVRRLGGAGEEPGSLRQVSGMAVEPGGTTLAVMSVGRSRLVRFRIRDGRLLGEVTVPEPVEVGQHWLFEGDTVRIPALMGGTGFRRWIPRRNTVDSWGQSPPSPLGSTRGYLVGGEFAAARHDADLLATVPGDSTLALYGPAGWVKGKVTLPVVRRGLATGTPEEQLRQMMQPGAQNDGVVVPTVLGVHRRPDGSYVVVHYQSESQDLEGTSRLEFARANYWISLLSADLAQGCVDGQLPDPPAELVRPIFHGDTVSLYVRHESAGDGVRHVLRKYLVSETGCQWLPVGSG